jgi:uroporphyrinogen decarboxylase
MTKRQRVEAVYRMEKADRIPFVPAIYEHKGRLVDKSPSEICRDGESLYTALHRELELYDPDMLVIGVDVYNVEAEALGCQVVYFEDSNDVPGIITPLIEGPSDLDKLGVPDPERDGRMPVYLDVAERMCPELGGEMILRGAVNGPYSMASMLLGPEKFVFATMEDPSFARRLLEFCAKVTVAFGQAFLVRGVEPIIFDSRATPKLASPRVFRQLVKPVYRDCVLPELKASGGRFVPLIIGGNTTTIVDELIATGAAQLLCDHSTNILEFSRKCLAARLPFRANVDALLVSRGPVAAIRRAALEILKRCGDQPGFLLGCGVVDYNVKPEFVHAISDAIADWGAGIVDLDQETAAPSVDAGGASL